MVCPSCGARNSDERTACSQCGRGLLALDDAQTVFLDEGAAVEPSLSKATAPVAAGILTPPPEPGHAMTWGSLPSQAVPMPSTIPAGTAFGRYRIETLLGEGGMGAVYKAYDTELNRTVALKLVRPELATNRQTMERFRQELLLASSISHKNILRIHDLGDWQGIKFITMAFVEGSDLAGLIERHGRLPMERALRFTRQFCAALEAAHNEGVVHRDLKPQNILIDASDNLYVSDFGLAKSLEAMDSVGTRTGQILGTPRYMSPEQVEARDVDCRSDLYSAGLIIYEMFTAELPFRGDSAMQLMYQRVSEPPRDPRSVVPDLPDYLAHLILRCLAKDPARRYQNAGEILRDLESMRAAPVRDLAGSKTISIQIPKPTRRGSLIAAVAALALTGTLAAIPTTRNAIRGLFAGTGAAQNGIQHRLAVLPLSLGDASDLKYIADGVGDALTAKLSGLHNVYVADSGTLTAAVLKQDDAKLAKTLGVTMLVKGTLQASGDRISITLKMEDTEKKRAPLIKEFSGVRQDLLTLEDEMFNALANSLVIRQTTAEKARTTARPTQDVGAYELYLKGVNLIRGRRSSVAVVKEALDQFDQATKVDASFALAYSGIADACIRMWQETKDVSWTQRAVSAAEQAERLNDNLPQVHNSLGTVYSSTGKTNEAFAEFKRALALEPNSDAGLRRLGTAYQRAGQLDLAVGAFAQAVKINPYYWNNHNSLGGAYYRVGQNEKALEAYKEVVRLNPEEGRGWGNMGAAYYRLGDWVSCIAALEKAIQLDPSFRFQLGVAYFFQGRYGDAAKAFESVVQEDPENAEKRVSLADAYRWSNQPEKAAAAYSKAIDLALNELKADPKSTTALGILAVSFARTGDPKQALERIRQARQIDRKENILMYREATVHTLASRLPEALASLKEALQNGYSPHEARADPDLKPLRDLPQFEALMRDAGKPQTK